jgi:hypothetical protein
MSITPYQQNGAAVAPMVPQQAPQVPVVAQLTEWAHGAQAAHEVAVNLVNTSFCPAHYRPKPGDKGEAAYNATAAILAGLEVGLQPMASLQAFHSIQGVAAPKAITLRAIVQSHGHSLDIVESSATRAVAVGRRNGTGTPQRSEWTIERAQTMGLPGKNPNWKSQPEAMLIARATAECARLVAADAILGIPYAVEELQDTDGGPVQATAEQVQPPAPARRRNAASVLPAQAEPAPEPERQGPIDPKGKLRDRMLELIRSTGIAREPFLALASEVRGKPVGSEKELTADEASAVIVRLEQLPAVGEATGAGE